MRRCIRLALGGRLTTAPNPMVGAVIVHDGRIIGEGYHHCHGEPHAEVNAIRSVRPKDVHLLKESTIYVSLEPCSHYGKTPPCADLIISLGIPRVVIGSRDTNTKVNGGGIRKLIDAGCEVKVGVLEKECRDINRKFFTYHEKHRPFITLKWAQTSDGVIGVEGKRLSISNQYTNMLCHRLRAEHQAIMVGHRTWMLDAPQLNVRHWTGRDPRIIVFSHETDLDKEFGNTQSILVEGGRETLQYFIDRDLWDQIQIETLAMPAPCHPGSRHIHAPSLQADLFADCTTTRLPDRTITHIRKP
ncbi:MAG: bifunctional diaminohydroxyphosphoribosylaminopyrimidine deaminase/5-amino-6-(5-phosphoribosylamino)uracil reductase RibD [Bacteroidaceae bacterium]|nr:bifunctional diaminohydroxyphosphoribosylaminopyrimidine deaminase/5-amino-6-(5-phosphoribosylamino)uracil reductase RibD [Bacteroidaceae bacterium]